MTPLATTDYSYKLISGVPDYTWYIGCAPTSGANIMAYWAKNGYPKLNTYSSTNSLINALATKMSTNRNTGGTSVSNMVSGMKSYITGKGYSATVTSYTGTFSRHVTEIKAGYPSWVTTENHPVWGDHAMTGVGYEEYYDTNALKWNRQLILHDTWSDTPKDYWVKWSSYFDYIIKVRPS